MIAYVLEIPTRYCSIVVISPKIIVRISNVIRFVIVSSAVLFLRRRLERYNNNNNCSYLITLELFCFIEKIHKFV